jgi:hypothetical protein
MDGAQHGWELGVDGIQRKWHLARIVLSVDGIQHGCCSSQMVSSADCAHRRWALDVDGAQRGCSARIALSANGT